jgi:Holliday junction resolvase RusA-like endonuclease
MIEREYVITLEPRGKGRPVFTRATGSARTPETTRAWEHEAAHQLRKQHLSHCGGRYYIPCNESAPLWEAEVRAYHRRPKTRPAHYSKAEWADTLSRLHATSRHDLDNVVKITLDAMQIGGVIANDRCIVSIIAGSYYILPGEEARVEVTMREVV